MMSSPQQLCPKPLRWRWIIWQRRRIVCPLRLAVIIGNPVSKSTFCLNLTNTALRGRSLSGVCKSEGPCSSTLGYACLFLGGPSLLHVPDLSASCLIIDPWILKSSYQPIPILHEAFEQDYQNLKTPLQSAGALFNLRV
jgi:hypothetical protein